MEELDTIDEQLSDDEAMDTQLDNVALEDDDPTVLTSAAPPDDDEVSPWPSVRSERRYQSMRGTVSSVTGSMRVVS
jgi:hypothetical protein